MRVSVELTLTLLQNHFKEPIINFIKRLRTSGLIVLKNTLCFYVYNEHNNVVNVLSHEIKDNYKLINIRLLYMKVMKTDKRYYEPSF